MQIFYSLRLRSENQHLKSDNASIRSDLLQTKQFKDEIILKNNELIAQLQEEIQCKTNEINKFEEQLHGNSSTQDLSSVRIKQLEEDLNNERQQRQRLVIEMHRLEQKCENLQSELQNGDIKTIPSDSNITCDSKFIDALDLSDLPVNIPTRDVQPENVLKESKYADICISSCDFQNSTTIIFFYDFHIEKILFQVSNLKVEFNYSIIE